MASQKFKKLLKEILKYRKKGWDDLSKKLIGKLIEIAFQDGEITREEYEHLIKMLNDDNVPPPPSYLVKPQ